METHSIPLAGLHIKQVLGATHFLEVRSRREAALLSPRLVITSKREGSRPSHLLIIPNTKRHQNDTKTDQLSIFEVITGR